MNMNNIRTGTLYAVADQLLQDAELEMDRSAEDVVTHLVCRNSRQSIENYLTGYLLDKLVSLPHPVTLAGLLEHCKTVDSRFADLDFTPIHCRFEEEDKDYCLATETVETCLRIARHAEQLVKG